MERAAAIGLLALAALALVLPASVPAHEAATPEPAGADWFATARAFQERNGSRHVYVCPADGKPQTTYGTDIYTDDSSVCTAAAHVGVIDTANGGTVTIEMRPGEQSYRALTLNGITTLPWSSWNSSFVVVSAQRGGGAAGVKMGGADMDHGVDGDCHRASRPQRLALPLRLPVRRHRQPARLGHERRHRRQRRVHRRGAGRPGHAGGGRRSDDRGPPGPAQLRGLHPQRRHLARLRRVRRQLRLRRRGADPGQPGRGRRRRWTTTTTFDVSVTAPLGDVDRCAERDRAGVNGRPFTVTVPVVVAVGGAAAFRRLVAVVVVAPPPPRRRPRPGCRGSAARRRNEAAAEPAEVRAR